MAIMNVTYRSKIIGSDIDFTVIYPFENINTDSPPKVLYFLHGAGDNGSTIARKTLIENYVENKNLAVVMPTAHRSYYTNMLYGRQYFDYISQELFLHFRKSFCVSLKKEDTFIAGMSMGGYGAMKTALQFPDLFSKCISLSGVCDVNNMKNNLAAKDRSSEFKGIFGINECVDDENDLYFLIKKSVKEKKQLPEFLLSCGTEDFLYKDNIKFHIFLKENKINHTFNESTGSHDWDFWSKEIPKIINLI